MPILLVFATAGPLPFLAAHRQASLRCGGVPAPHADGQKRCNINDAAHFCRNLKYGPSRRKALPQKQRKRPQPREEPGSDSDCSLYPDNLKPSRREQAFASIQFANEHVVTIEFDIWCL